MPPHHKLPDSYYCNMALTFLTAPLWLPPVALWECCIVPLMERYRTSRKVNP